MRLWSIDPAYLDSKGLVALWREALLAQKVLLGETKGYKNHPQLERFKKTNNPVGAIATYLRAVAAEAETRKYNFDKSKIRNLKLQSKIRVTNGQLVFEYSHLLNKLKTRDPQRYKNIFSNINIKTHPMFINAPGEIEKWEIL